MDRISELPKGITDHILSFINTPKELVRMSVLSKHWFHLTASFPLLVFKFCKFIRGPRERFFKYVEYTTSRFCQQNVIANKFKLNIWIRKPAEFDIVYRCLQLILENGVRELVIINAISRKHRLPDLRSSVSVLKRLKISRFELPSSLMVDALKFKSLIRLTLVYVTVDDEMIEYLTTSCPLLQTFEIIRCSGFKRFHVYGHQNLRKVRIGNVERIDIEAPNLSVLGVVNRNGIGTPQMNVNSCKKLTTVTCGHLVPNSNEFTDILSNFPFIEHLTLITDYTCKNLKLSSYSLRTLVLQSNCDLKDIEFNTPSLVLFVYCGFRYWWKDVMDKQWPLLRDSNCLKPCMYFYPNEDIDPLWLHKLRLFLGKKNGFKVFNLYIRSTYEQDLMELDNQKLIELPPYELEHVELQLEPNKESSAHIAFVDDVLLSFRPRSLTLRSFFPLTDFEDVVKFTYEKLLEQEDQGVADIQIVSPSCSQAQKHLRDLKSISIALPPDRNAISFTKEKVVKEANKQANSQKCADLESS